MDSYLIAGSERSGLPRHATSIAVDGADRSKLKESKCPFGDVVEKEKSYWSIASNVLHQLVNDWPIL